MAIKIKSGFRKTLILRKRRKRSLSPKRSLLNLLLLKKKIRMKAMDLLMRIWNAKIVEMHLCLPVVNRSFTNQRVLTTNLSAARSARTPRNPAWRVEVVAVVEVEVALAVVVETAMAVVVAEVEVCAMLSRRVTVPEAAHADSATRVVEVEVVAAEVEVALVVVVETAMVAVVEEAEVCATHIKRVTAPEAVHADSATIKSRVNTLYLLFFYEYLATWFPVGSRCNAVNML